MKNFRLLLALMLVVLIFSSCVKKNTSCNDHTIKVEFIENNYLVLNPCNITINSYKNPRNIFLEIKSLNDNQTRMTANWYKKTNGVYQLFCLNDTGRKLNQNLAYEVIDTLNLSKEIINYRNANVDSIDLAYQGKTILLNRDIKREHLKDYWWTKMTVTSEDSVLRYNPETKSFYKSTTYRVTKIKNDFGPIIILAIFFLLTVVISLKERLKWLKKSREYIFNHDFFGIITANDHKLNSLLLFIIVSTFNLVYGLWLIKDNVIAILVFAILTGFLARLIFWLDQIKFKIFKDFNFNTSFSIMLISVIYALIICLAGLPQEFCYITSIIVVLPALLDAILFTIEQNKLKRSQDKKAWYEKIEK